MKMNNSPRKTIYLLRHAKSSWNSNAMTDFDRPLSERGKSDTKLIAKTLKELNYLPEKIIASPAIRARQTCLTLCKNLQLNVDEIVEWDSNFYEAYMITLLQTLIRLPENLHSVMLIGHNPSMEDLLLHLCTNVPRQTNGKIFTTANVAKLEVTVPWKDLILEGAYLENLIRPKEIH